MVVSRYGLPIALIIAGVYMLWRALQDIRSVRSSRNWPCVMGEIVRHQDGLSSGSPAQTRRAYYVYGVDGRRYDGSISNYDLSPDQSVYTLYPVGQAVSVFYNPDRPKQSLLVREQGSNWCFLAFALAALGGGIWIMVMTWMGA